MSGILDEGFLEACGIAGRLWLTAERTSDGSTTLWSGRQPFAMIGSNSNADLQLDHETISRRHVYLQAVEGRLFGMDSGSRTGIRRGGEPWRSGWLSPGDRLEVGPFKVCIEGDGWGRADGLEKGSDDPGPLSSRYRSSERLPGVSLEIRCPGRPPFLTRMGRVMLLLGSGPDCKLRFSDANVDRFHCSLLRTRSGVWVVDLLSERGTYLNGNYVRAALLEDGDELQIGFASILIKLDGQSRAVRRQGSLTSPSKPQSQALVSLMSEMLHASEMGAQLPVILPKPPAGLSGSNVQEVSPYIQQFGALQQQMFDQFHQLMMGMLQAFGAMHREQMGAVSEDLDRLDQITRELRALQSQPTLSPSVPAEPVESGPVPLPPMASIPGRNSVNGDEAKIHEISSPAPEVRMSQAGPASRPNTVTHVASSATHNLDPIEILRKVQELQFERQGRWQRIVGFLLGSP